MSTNSTTASTRRIFFGALCSFLVLGSEVGGHGRDCDRGEDKGDDKASDGKARDGEIRRCDIRKDVENPGQEQADSKQKDQCQDDGIDDAGTAGHSRNPSKESLDHGSLGKWCARRDSNPWPQASEACALIRAELRAHMALPARFELAAYRLGGGRSIQTELWEQLKKYIIYQ